MRSYNSTNSRCHSPDDEDELSSSWNGEHPPTNSPTTAVVMESQRLLRRQEYQAALQNQSRTRVFTSAITNSLLARPPPASESERLSRLVSILEDAFALLDYEAPPEGDDLGDASTTVTTRQQLPYQ